MYTVTFLIHLFSCTWGDFICPFKLAGHKSTLNVIGGTDVEVETPILWPPDAKN